MKVAAMVLTARPCVAHFRLRVMLVLALACRGASKNNPADGNVAAVLDASGQVTPAPRRLQVDLPNVPEVDFQDFDLDYGEITGTVTWTTPYDPLDSVTGYAVYLTDSAGTHAGRIELGTTALGVNHLVVPNHTATENLTHVFVHTRSAAGTSPHGTGYPVCDIDLEDSLWLVNAVAMPQRWGVRELSFYTSPNCTDGLLRMAQGATGQDSLAGYPPENAFDGDDDTVWVSDCTSCNVGSTTIGGLGICNVREVRCIKIKQCVLDWGGVCPTDAGMAPRMSLLVRGSNVFTWKVLPYDDQNTNGKLNDGRYEEELLIVAGRRRRAAYGVFGDVDVPSAALTNPQFKR
eukprot:gnl/TRDRNA2_/TRDRNA2_171702_c1_seq1.p1 gnl/TRDRNA2_/TRDRNA2_171702_c1~~gnl/TRDRNA2_/TRDRNA2_171702_c1_seq1.p1  ORF type:complete len:347 (+),score=33.87 gnl/TRDRNA2_/TRDRNA2_171702_c1_seq1:120-1160(+)